jgi:hypothetical protein
MKHDLYSEIKHGRSNSDDLEKKRNMGCTISKI